jgi:putative oxidoreductase
MYTLQVSKAHAFLAFVARLCMSCIFLVSAFLKMMHWPDYAVMMANHGLPAVPALLSVAIIIELVCGLMLLTGVMARFGSLLLILYLIPVTFVMHNIWTVPPDQVMTQLINMFKNLAIMGGLFMVSAFGPGPLIIQEKWGQVVKEDQKSTDSGSKQSPSGLAGVT